MGETKALPSVVARAFATVEVTKEMPCTYPSSRNPRWIYFLKPGNQPSDLLLRAWRKLPFVEFEPFIETTGKVDSTGRYWRLRKEYRSK
jgi:hypothetical protein